MEPTTSAAAALGGAAVSVSAITAFGVPLGLHADVLLAGFAGALGAITFLNAVPGGADTKMELLRTSMRRLMFAWVSSLTAGYITPLALLVAQLPQSVLLGIAFLVGFNAQRVIGNLVARFWPQPKQEG